MTNRRMTMIADFIDAVIELTAMIVVIVAGIKYIFWG